MKVLILAGGSGTRLWPLSRERYPKQFIKFDNSGISLFQETFRRSLLLTNIEDVYVITNKNYKFLVMGEIRDLGYNYNEDNILVEPEAKNTLPAIYLGVKKLSQEDDTIIVFPSDHIILNNNEFINKIKSAEYLAEKNIVTFGIKPTEPNTGYGYIEPGEKIIDNYIVNHFKEKPIYEKAVEYIEKGYFWNAGIFMFNTLFFIELVKRYEPNIFEVFEKFKSTEEVFANIEEGTSIDYSIIEKCENVIVVPVDIGWNDLGSFDSFYNVFKKDKYNNIINGENILVDSSDNFIYSKNKKLVSVIGVKDLIIVDTDDVLLMCKKSQSQKVKNVVNTLKLNEDERVKYHTEDYRPWGSYKIIDEEKNNFKVKKIIIAIGEKISYQSHKYRSEHWIVVGGLARVTIDEKVKNICTGESMFISRSQKHKIENVGDVALEIIEVQIGDYLEEDDIIRFEDKHED